MNDGFVYREQLGGEARGQTALGYLARRYRHSSLEVWRERLNAGEVQVDGETAHPDLCLQPGQWLTWRRPPWQEPTVPLSYAVLYRDAHLLAVAKPRDLPCLPNGGFLTHTLLRRVQRDHPEATALHRLGRGTSGLVLFARTLEARQRVSSAWRQGQVEKVYRALARGRLTPRRLAIDVPIGVVPHPRLGHVHAASPEGRPALTYVRVVEHRGDATLVEVTIPTGRPHQIRIHLAAAGHPLVGDPLYVAGGQPGPSGALPGDPGYHLHAWRLSLEHPADGRPLSIECAPPPVLREEGRAAAGGVSGREG